jgi:hypothetical protein
LRRCFDSFTAVPLSNSLRVGIFGGCCVMVLLFLHLGAAPRHACMNLRWALNLRKRLVARVARALLPRTTEVLDLIAPEIEAGMA